MLRLVADLYYLRGRSQPEIAELTGFSVSKVSRLLTQARERGIVHISIERDPDDLRPLERELSAALGITVALTAGSDPRPVLAARLCGVAAGPLVAEQLPISGVVGISGGYTISALITGMPPMQRPGLTVVPLVGGSDAAQPHLDVNEAVRRMAERIGALARPLHAPAVLDSEATKRALLEETTIRTTTAYWEKLDLALLAIGGSPTGRPGYGTIMDRLDEEGRERLGEKGAVGDVAGHLYRIDGTLVDDPWASRTIAIPIDLLRRTPRRIAIAAGSTKVESVIGLARTGLVDQLVTDQSTAEAALRLLSGVRAVARS